MENGTGYTDDEDDEDDPISKAGCVIAKTEEAASKDKDKDEDGAADAEGTSAPASATDGDGAPLPEEASEAKEPGAGGDAGGDTGKWPSSLSAATAATRLVS